MVAYYGSTRLPDMAARQLAPDTTHASSPDVTTLSADYFASTLSCDYLAVTVPNYRTKGHAEE